MLFIFSNQQPAYEMRISDWSSDVCSSDLLLPAAVKSDPRHEPLPRYWVSQAEIDSRLIVAQGWTHGWLMGWRDICRSTDERTVIAAFVPRTAVGHTFPLFFIDPGPQFAAAIVGNLTSLILDFVERQKVGGTHLTSGYLKQFPVIRSIAYTHAALTY